MLKEKAYAKINLFLNVVGKRFDGYHDLEMVMASLELHDLLSFKVNSTGEITVTSDKQITQSPTENIVYKVATFLQDEFNVAKGVEIHIKKNIPIAAGLGGGSADAAATFRGLAKVWKLKLSLDDMAKLAIDFGADIPFCIYNKTAIARGKGEELMFVDKKMNQQVLLVNPNIRISTKEVFGKVDTENIIRRKITNMTSAIINCNCELMIRELHNSLEPIVFEMEESVKNIKHQMLDWGLDGALMTGSGATVFGFSKNKSIMANYMKTIPDDFFYVLTKIR